MPPKAKITKEMILKTVLDITRQTGFEAVNARSIANKLQCSTRPIFTCYKNMDELKREFLDFAFEVYNQYVADYRASVKADSCLILPLSYVAFAREETNLFQLLFINDMDLNMTEAEDFYKEAGNEEKARIFSDSLGIEWEFGKAVFLDLFLYSHGIAVLTATGKVSFDRKNVEQMLKNLLSAFINQDKPNGNSLPPCVI